MSDMSRLDRYLSDDGPAALVIREYLMPVEGTGGVVFPATYAAGDGFPGGYNIDRTPDGEAIALIDSVGSQANRIEPIFRDEQHCHLVPQITVKAGDKDVSIFDASHRAGDALLRCSSLQDELREAFRAELNGDCSPLAKIAPTSLVFGVWDSRDTQSKRPRVVSSTIRAYGVRQLTRGAVYIPPVDYASLDVFSEEDKAKAEGNKKSPLAQRGFVHNPASASHGGVIADGGIRRDATLGLAALRMLHAGGNQQKTLALRRYILGLSLVAFTSNPSGYLRQGCLLVLDPDRSKENEFVEVFPNGGRKPCTIRHDDALEYATAAAEAFGVGESRAVPFEKEKAQRDVREGSEGKSKRRSKDKNATVEPGDDE